MGIAVRAASAHRYGSNVGYHGGRRPRCAERPRRRAHEPVTGMYDGDSTVGDLMYAVRKFHDVAVSWHGPRPVTSSVDNGVAARALHLHAMNFDLWHHEDAVR